MSTIKKATMKSKCRYYTQIRLSYHGHGETALQTFLDKSYHMVAAEHYLWHCLNNLT